MAKPAREYFWSLCILKLEDKQLYCMQLEISKVRKQNHQLWNTSSAMLYNDKDILEGNLPQC